MNRHALWALLGVAAVLVAIIGAEALELNEPEVWPPSAPQPSSSVTNGTQTLASPSVQAFADTILLRPLFQSGRRPAPATAAGGVADGRLPRLTAVVINGAAKSVIFVSGTDGKAIVAGEGGRVGPYLVQSIADGQATIVGPEGTRTVRPSFGGSAPRLASPVTGPTGAAAIGTGQPSIMDQLLAGKSAAMRMPGLATQRPPGEQSGGKQP
jgi:hypothetical protein